MTDNERIKALRKRAYELTRSSDETDRQSGFDINFLLHKLDRFRTELEWFADPDNYVGDHDEDGYHSAPIANGFKRAQRALEGMES